ncbi:TonB family protein [Azospirillum argentinense]|uniref:TonB family protein n=1 Tax=Azospirillum argentinense TaxID=2970906 RepID=A0A2K1FZY0_9PROT|nr:TonB family protein [Azospirillum argentinense]PNQ98101.1 TonB family protein [Azospirillum argentinense]
MDGMRAGDAAIVGEGEGHGPWAPWAFVLSALAHAALLGLLIAAAETPTVPVPEAVSVDVVPGNGVETAGDAGGGPDGRGESDVEPPPAAPAAEPAPDPEPRPVEAVPLPDPSPPDVPDSVAPLPARKPTVKPVTAATRVPLPAAPAKDMAGNRDGAAAATGPTAGPAMGSGMNGSAVADAGAGGGGADAMRVYLEEVRRRLQARLAVPAEARRLRLGGTVLVRFTVQRDGSVPGESMAVLSGPGVAVLERAALETVARTAPFPPPPKPATVEVPVLFAVSVR